MKGSMEVRRCRKAGVKGDLFYAARTLLKCADSDVAAQSVLYVLKRCSFLFQATVQRPGRNFQRVGRIPKLAVLPGRSVKKGANAQAVCMSARAGEDPVNWRTLKEHGCLGGTAGDRAVELAWIEKDAGMRCIKRYRAREDYCVIC